ncbi:MAG: UDP-3-O-(3-hydroxymyristoyl)glucosamine N-acyltransferase [Candidatus Eisenbacteria bacterium]|uniref:UDP-3-O-acylglucosamine N-acyltransferase n=1 Tax=Eiseniibacteriota bacterium TaxID=2212470 RepID=A0A948RSW1_UNCEI|nr:UDP-3-O-(3-hydroxymyristoyl)glucosamine N-acyltransferase [Candidatus Eisenbacteria bacterium]MBU1949230.1 UDP-3-O-(3-hydroxymyristoyl)glucosamine N-acyltransferase [Candidatus Eisenbacteria bacterium]MBU2690270.1 UDP-3-O-(3-hydroxymyristoyl)glucosamine N-acyltransferase [Candidatus Eisenbacteria bacterium]
MKTKAENKNAGAGGKRKKTYSLGELARLLSGSLSGDPDIPINGINGIREAVSGEITFLSNPRYTRYLKTTGASAVILGNNEIEAPIPLIKCADPYGAFLMILGIFSNPFPPPAPGVHATAVIGSNVQLSEGASIGPNVVIEDDVVIGARTTIRAGVFIGRNSILGADGLIYPRVVINEDSRLGDRVIIHSGAVIGADGFGYLPGENGFKKIPQLGRVVLEDDVEVGANSTIDRATVGETRIGRGTRIDNLVQVAHNVIIGENSILCAQVGISGSTEIGRNVTLAGQAGIVGHIQIGDGVKVGAQGGVTKTIPEGQEVSGYPAMQHSLAKRIYASMRHLPEALQQLRRLSERVNRLERKLKE